jgi:DNA polymerase V
MTPGQTDLFESAAFDRVDRTMLMKTLDEINQRFPKSTRIAAAGFEQSWKPKAERISKRYTTHWEELVIIKC